MLGMVDHKMESTVPFGPNLDTATVGAVGQKTRSSLTSPERQQVEIEKKKTPKVENLQASRAGLPDNWQPASSNFHGKSDSYEKAPINGPILPLHHRVSTRDNSHHHKHRPKRLPRLSFLPNRIRNELVAMIAEFSGTFMFLFVAFCGTQVANQAATRNNQGEDHSLSQVPNANTLLYISMSFGFSLTVNVWLFFRISGGLFNPAVTLGLFLVGAITASRAVACFIAQLLGGIAAAAVVSGVLPGALNVSTTLGPRISIARGLFLEMFLTAELVFAIYMLAVEKHKATFLAPIGIGLALFVAEMSGVYFTGGSLNPARSFGPACITGYFDGYHWIYWLGPCLGTLLAYGFYELLKFGEYQTINPGQDFNDHEIQMFRPPAEPVTAEEVQRPNPTAVAAQVAVQQAALEIERKAKGQNPELTTERSISQERGLQSKEPHMP